MREPDPKFADPRLAVLYDVLDHDRSDLDVYLAIVDELGARSVVDIGCGTGSFVVLLAERGIRAIGVDPASASLEVARAKPYADRATWVDGDATALAGLNPAADLAVMTGNVAQVFVEDADWHATLAAAHGCLRDGGFLVLETRRPEARAWEGWETPPTEQVLPDGSTVRFSQSVDEVALPLVTFTTLTEHHGQQVPSTSVLRFRPRDDVAGDLDDHGFEVVDVREAPDRPGLEHVFVARKKADWRRGPS